MASQQNGLLKGGLELNAYRPIIYWLIQCKTLCPITMHGEISCSKCSLPTCFWRWRELEQETLDARTTSATEASRALTASTQ